jgi:hypothetical protein
VAWALSTQLGQITPWIDCRQSVPWTAIGCVILLAASVAGTTASRFASMRITRPGRFVVDVSFLVALAFLFALVLQGAATSLLDPCQH